MTVTNCVDKELTKCQLHLILHLLKKKKGHTSNGTK